MRSRLFEGVQTYSRANSQIPVIGDTEVDRAKLFNCCQIASAVSTVLKVNSRICCQPWLVPSP